MTGDNFILGQGNVAEHPTALVTGALTDTALIVQSTIEGAIRGASDQDFGVHGRSRTSTGVVGDSQNQVGVMGTGSTIGVSGSAFNRDAGIGVAGDGTRVGVFGTGERSGVWGTSRTTGGVGARGDAEFLGVFGNNLNSTPGRLVAGVQGSASSDTGIGVNGQSDLFFGVRGLTRNTSFSAPAAGVFGAGTSGGNGVMGSATGLGFAGLFLGDVVVTGGFIVNGRKSASVPFPDGSRRLLYSVESPESWFEDFGAARLVKGRAIIALDRKFLSVVRGAYHVFLSPEGDCRGLYVSRKSAGRFEVREFQGGTASVPFSYRLVARRKDVKAERFEKARTTPSVDGADIAIIDPEAPEPPKAIRSQLRSRRRKTTARFGRRR
jgi:hypothetical protein